MAITVFKNLDNAIWVDVSDGNNFIFVSNVVDHDIKYVVSESLPSSSDNSGHILRPGDSIKFNASGPDNLYMRGTVSKGRVAVNADDNISKDSFNRDFYFEVARGNLKGFTPVSVVGHDREIGTGLATVGNNVGAIQTHSTTANIDSISSDNVNDLHDITIEGLDVNYDVVAPFSVTLNGQSRVALPSSLIRVNRVYNATGTVTQGSIWVYVDTSISAGKPDDTSMIRSSIHRTVGGSGSDVSNEVDTNTVFTIPNNMQGFIVFGKTTVSDNKALELTFWGRRFGGVFFLTHHIDIKNNNYDYFFKLPQVIPAKSDVEVRAFVDNQTAEVSAVYDIILVDI